MNCRNCHDQAYVCENHPGKPWGDLHDCAAACHCGGAGMPCPACCSPIPEDRSVSIGLAFIPDWRRLAYTAIARDVRPTPSGNATPDSPPG